jgi:hypothetical protein
LAVISGRVGTKVFDAWPWSMVLARALMGIGVWQHLSEQHKHRRRHVPDTHERWHTDDKAPSTSIPPGSVPVGTWHKHSHAQPRIDHSHARYPDAHHCHGHDADHDTPCLGCPQRSGPQRSEDTRGGGRRDAKRRLDPDSAPDSAVGCHGCAPGLHRANHSPLRSSSTVVSGRVRLVRWDVDELFGTGAGCRRAGD